MTKELRSERLKTIVGITIHQNVETGEKYESVRVGEDTVKRIKSSRQNGYVIRKGVSVKELESTWQDLPYPMKKIDALKFAAYNQSSQFISNPNWVRAFEEKIDNIQNRLDREANRKPRLKINSAEQLLSMIRPQSLEDKKEHLNDNLG